MTSTALSGVHRLFLPFLVWTMTTFLCNKLAKEFLVMSSHDMTSLAKCGLALVLTVAQSVVCVMTLSPASGLPRSVSTVAMVSHFLAALTTNLSLAFIHAASTFAIKMTEPVVMAIAQRLAFKKMIAPETWVSLPPIIIGALIFTDATVDKATSLGVSLAMASNVILAARNISVKILQESLGVSKYEPEEQNTKKVTTLREKKVLVIGYTSLGLCVILYLILNNNWLFQDSVLKANSLLALLGSAVFHVAKSYTSVNIALGVMTVVSHSVTNIFKRLLVVLLLYAGGQRSAAPASWLGLALSMAGLGIYILPQLRQTSRPDGNGSFGLPALRKISFLIIGLVLCLVLVTTITNVTTMSVDIFNLQSQLHGYLTNQSAHQLNTNQTALRKQSMHINALSGTSYQPNRNLNESLDFLIQEHTENKEFISQRLLDIPTETDFLSKQLTDNAAIVAEAQRIHLHVMKDLVGAARHVMLFEIATYENKGDPAITVGETLLFRKLNLSLVYYCSTSKCRDMKNAQKIADKYAKDDVVIFMQGGGNLVGYHYIDQIRERVLKAFPQRLKVLFSQSIWMHNDISNDLKDSVRIYSNRTNFVMYLRDRNSLRIAQKNFVGIKHILMPDMAWNIGLLPRQLPPAFDVLWLKRSDNESPKYSAQDVLKDAHFTCHVSDYYHNWPSNKGVTELETSFLITSTGLQFLQRGRVLITDRLHGHILASLLNIPHVLFDNPPFYKLSSFHKSWTARQRDTVIVDSAIQAVKEAQKMLTKYDNVLPKIGPYMDKKIWEHNILSEDIFTNV